jgi:hypothetical protein
MVFNNISTIFQLIYIVAVSFIGVTRKPHLQTLSHNVISSTPRLKGIRTRNVSGYRYGLHR